MSEPEASLATEGSSHQASSWVKLLRTSVIVSVIVIVLINVFAGLIPPLVMFALIWLIGLFWLSRATKGPAILLLLNFVAFLALSAPFVIPSLAVPASAGDFILNIASLLAALAGVVAAVNVVRGRLGASDAPGKLGLALVGLFVLGTALSIFSLVTYEDAEAQEGDLELVTKDIEFQDTSLEAGAGTVSVFVNNEDATLHTFTIEELDVDLAIPASKAARISFEAPPGTYKFFCAPHEEDMQGTLVIK